MRSRRLGRVLVINLDRDQDRLDWMSPQLDALGLPWSRQSAFTPDTVPDRIRRNFAPAAETVLLPNNIASFASHLAAIETAAEVDDWTLVLEDDVAIECTADDLQALVAAASDANAHILRLATPAKSSTIDIQNISGFRVIQYLNVPRGAGAYAIDRIGAEQVLKRATGLVITTDNFLRDVAGYGVATLGVMPPPIPQDRFGESSIDPGRVRQKRAPRYTYDRGTIAERLRRRCDYLRWVGVGQWMRMVLKQVLRRRG